MWGSTMEVTSTMKVKISWSKVRMKALFCILNIESSKKSSLYLRYIYDQMTGRF